MIRHYSIYDELAIFLAGLAPEKVLQYHASAQTQARLEELLWKNKEGALTEAEQNELEGFMTIEHLVRLAKARAHQMLQAAA